MTKGRELYRERKRIRSQPGADFFVVAVDEGSAVANRTVAEIAWPQDAVLVSIQRSTAVLVPHGDTQLRVGDILTAFGSGESRGQVETWVRVQPTSSEDTEAS
jgi:Trk K+ transport system NAD-binding subunit